MDIWENEHSKSYPTRAISLMWNQRSVDTFLGLPFNIASYGLLLEIIATEVNMVPDELIGNLGDTHLYLNHVEQAKEQIGRELDLDERRAMVTQEMFNQIYNAGDSSTLTHSEIDQWDIPRIKTREPYPLPTLVINDEFWASTCLYDTPAEKYKNAWPDLTLHSIAVHDFTIDNYQAHLTIKAPLSN
jgi:thymidylate synthase